MRGLRSNSSFHLDKVDLLSGLDERTQQRIVSCLKYHKFKRGDIVFRKGSLGQSLYFIEQGVMNVVVGNDDADPKSPSSYIVDTIQAGSVFGEMALLLSMPRTATICTQSPTAIVFELQRKDFEAAAASSSVLNDRLQAIKEERFVRFRQDLETACLNPDHMDAKQRAYLLEVFTQIDTDGSGAIDEEELSVMLTRLTGRCYPKEQVTAMMNMLDEDGNGTIEEEEFIAGLPLLAKWLIITSTTTSSASSSSHDDGSSHSEKKTTNHHTAAELDLDKVDLLKGIDADTRLKLTLALKRRQYVEGDLVFKKGSTGQSLFFLQSGVMEVIVGDGDADPTRPELACICVDQIQPGSVFGEMALLLSVPRTATLCTATPTAVAFELERDDFEAAAASSSILKQRLDEIKQQRFARFRKDLETAVLRPEDMDDKQRAYLIEVFKQIDADGSGAIDEEELAFMLCRLAGHTFPDKEVAAMMKLLDKDGNKTIEVDEFLEGLPLLAKWLVSTNDRRKPAELVAKTRNRFRNVWNRFSTHIQNARAQPNNNGSNSNINTNNNNNNNNWWRKRASCFRGLSKD